MNKNHQFVFRKEYKIATTIVLLLLSGSFLKLHAQCKYVTNTEAGDKIEIVLPNVFPIYHFLNDPKTEDIKFSENLNSFKLLNPALDQVIFKPLEIPNNPNTYIEIPEIVLESLPIEDRQAILFLPSFYKVVKY